MRIDNTFLVNILMFCDSKNESENLILLLFVKLENTKSWSTFLFFNFYFSVWFAKFCVIRLTIIIVKKTIIAFKV